MPSHECHWALFMIASGMTWCHHPTSHYPRYYLNLTWVIVTIFYLTYQLCCCSMCKTPQRCDSQEINCNNYTSTQVAADRGALRIWRWVSLPEGGQKFWSQWHLADTAWLAGARIAATRSAMQRKSNAPTQSHSLQRNHPHLNSIFASKLHAQDPLDWVICIRLIRWHGALLQAVVIMMKILLPDPEKLPSSLWSRNLRVLPKLVSGHVIAICRWFKFLS